MKGSSSEPILINNEESLPDVPVTFLAIFLSPNMSFGHS
jgi:hypothetical protein